MVCGITPTALLRMHPPHCPACTTATAVYHVTAEGWTKVRGDDVVDLHYKYYPEADSHPAHSAVL